MFKFETNGFDELQNELKKMQQAAQDLEGEQSVPFDELFDSSFMNKHTSFNSFEDFLSAGNFNPETNEAFEAIPDDEMDNHVSKTTNFKDWEDMLGTAVEEYTFKQLGL